MGLGVLISDIRLDLIIDTLKAPLTGPLSLLICEISSPDAVTV